MIKKQNFCRFTDQCIKCTARNTCLSPTKIVADLRKSFLLIKGHRLKPTFWMKKGKEAHKNLLKQYDSLEKLGKNRFQKQLFTGKTIKIRETGVCSSLSGGMHGIIDLLELKYDAFNRTFDLKVTEIKTGRYRKAYFKQLCSYCYMLTDTKSCFLSYETATKRQKRRKRVAFQLYPPKKSFYLNITAILKLNQQKPYEIPFMCNNVMTDLALGTTLQLTKMVYNKQKWTKALIYYLSEIKPCSYCPKDASKCSLWDICSKVNYKEEAKTEQKYFGKKQLLIKSKPLLKRR